jgi:hypothetical protein
VPLRSVEAASRDDAIAAAREQFGPQARVVGVRRVRSGGVLGFFATERYVAEVAAEPPGRPVVPVPASARTADTDVDDDSAPADFSSPLASAAPARARAAAPARNGAAAWAAEAAARTPDGEPAVRTAARTTTPAAARSSAPAWKPAPVHPAAVAPRVDDDRVSELAGLLTSQQPESSTPAYARAAFPRAAFPRTGSEPAASLFGDQADEPHEDQRVLPTAPVSGAPSPFTAALARMVAGDQDVRQAVKEVLDQPAGAFARAVTTPSPTRPGPVAPAESSVEPPAAPQEEETVGDPVVAPTSAVMDRPVEVPTWAAEPELPATAVSPREEAIADLLRGALAQGHSDEALAGILRKVLAGASPQAALTEPEVAAPVPAPAMAPSAPRVAIADNIPAAVVPAPVEPAPVAPAAVIPAPVVEEVAPEAPMFEDAVEQTPVVEHVATEAPVFDDVVVADDAAFAAPEPEAQNLSAWTFGSAQLFGDVTTVAQPHMWGIDVPQVTLWGEPVEDPAPAVEAPSWDLAVSAPSGAGQAAAPIWAEVAEQESSVDAALDRAAAEPVAEAVTESVAAIDDAVPAEAVAETAVEEIVVEEIVVEEIVEEQTFEAEVAEMEPVLARTASDPAPMMSLDATTIMPPLSLLPPLPSSRGRGRGRPPVPMSSSRSSAARAAATPAATPEVELTAPAAADPAPAQTPRVDAGLFDDAPTVKTPPVRPSVVETAAQPPAPYFLATVTRLPVAPLMAAPETPEMAESADLDEPVDTAPVVVEPEAVQAAVVEAPVEVAVEAPAVVEAPPAEGTVPAMAGGPTAPAPLAPMTPADVVSRLETLGVPTRFLGASFADDVAVHGAYAALTHALALRLSKAPELPSGAGEVLFVVGPGVETLRTAQSLAASLRLDPDRVQWATRGDLAGLAPKASRMTTVETAIDRRQEAADAGTVTIVAVDAPLRTDAYWMSQMLAIWSPVAVWAVVEATRKPEDLEPWIDGLPRVDALVVQDTDLSADPAAVLRQVALPVALLDGVPATPHRWASLLCERLESTKA